MKLITRTVWLTYFLCCPFTYCILLLTDFLSCREWMSRHTYEMSIWALGLPYFSSLLLLEQFCTLREICVTWHHVNQGLCRILIHVISLQSRGGFMDDFEASMTSLCTIRVLTMTMLASLGGWIGLLVMTSNKLITVSFIWQALFGHLSSSENLWGHISLAVSHMMSTPAYLALIGLTGKL